MPLQPSPLLDQVAGGFAPLVTGTPYMPMTGMEGFPVVGGGGMTGLLAQIMLGPQLQQMMGRYGMMPLGIGHDQNVFDVLRNQAFTQQHRGIMAQAAQQERANYMRTFRGIAAMTGTPWGAQQRHDARTLADAAVSAAPILAEIAPEFLDQLGGMRGSPTVMAARMSMGSRYAIDPLTGRMGMSADSVNQMQQRIYDDLFNNGDIRAMRGMTAGQVGGLYDEMTRRGMIGTPGTVYSRTRDALSDLGRTAPDNLLRAAANQGVAFSGDISKLTAADMDKLRLDPAVADRIKSLNTEQIKRSIKSYTDVVAAMRDIFGDMGRPNAPMSELLQHLEALTQGAIGKIDPGRLNMMVRQTHELARQSGMGLDQALGIQQHAASRLQALGLDPLHAVQVAQGSMAWGGAFRAQGGASVPAWGRFNADQMTQLDANLRASAVGSEQANRMAVLMRIRQSVGGFMDGSEAERMAQAIMAGQTEYVDQSGQSRSLAMPGDEFARIVLGAKSRGGKNLGIDEGQFMSMMGQKTVNEQFTERWNIGDIARRQQAGESRSWVASRMQETMRQRLVSAGVDEDTAEKASADAAQRASGRIMRMGHGEFADDRTRTDAMGRIIREELAATGAGVALSGKGMDTKEFYQQTADQFYGYWTQSILRDQRMRGFRNAQNMHAAMNEATMGQAARNATQARFAAQMADVLSPLGRGSVLQRAVQALQDTKEGDSGLDKLLARTLGVSQDDIQGGLRDNLLKVRDEQRALQKLHEQFESATDSESRTRITKQIEDRKAALSAEVRTLVDIAGKRGIFVGEGTLTGRQTASAAQSLMDMRDGTKQTADLTNRAKAGSLTKEEQDQMRNRLRDFWYSDSGAMARDQVNDAMSGAADVAERAVMDRRLIGRLGPQAIEQYKRIESSQQELRQLALEYANGDIARLVHGDLSIDRTTAEGAKKYKAIMDSVNKHYAGMAEGVSFFGKGIGKEGRQWGDDDQQTAWQILGYSGEAKKGYWNLDDAKRKEVIAMQSAVHVAKQMSMADEEKLRDYKSKLSGEAGIEKKAEGFGMSVEQYVAAVQRAKKPGELPEKMRKLTQSELDAAKASADEFVKSREEATKIAGRIGALDVKSAVNALGAIEALDARADTYQRMASMGGAGLSTELLKAYGIEPTTSGDAASRIANFAQSRDQQGFMRSLIGGVAYLKEIAKKKGGFEVMMEDYRKIGGISDEAERNRQLNKFRADYGIDDGAEWGQVQKQLNVQRYVEKIGGGKFTGDADRDIKVLERGLSKLGTSGMEVAKQMQQGPMEVRLTGGSITVDFKNKTVSSVDAKGTTSAAGS